MLEHEDLIAIMHVQARFAKRTLLCLLLFLAAANSGTCQPCGTNFQPACPGAVPCPVGFLDPIGLCAFGECGVPDNSCCPSIGCGTITDGTTGVEDLFECREFGGSQALEGVNREAGLCLPCGRRGLPACMLFDRPPCRAGLEVDGAGVCVECGGQGQTGCLEGDGLAPCQAGLVLTASGICGDAGSPLGQYGE